VWPRILRVAVRLVALGIKNRWYDGRSNILVKFNMRFKNLYQPLVHNSFCNQLVAGFKARCSSPYNACANDTDHN
jgi:hypothetical protein